MAYAEVSDLEARWKPLTEQEQEVAETLLEDASAMLDALVNVDGKCTQVDLLKIVCCNMVQRSMTAGAMDAFGITQQSMTAGPYTQSWTLSNPSGDMYLTKMEKKLLGITGSYIGTIRAKVGGRCDTGHNCNPCS